MRQGTPGLSFGRPEVKLGWCAQPTAAVQLDAVRVPASHRLGAEGDGFRIAMAARAPLLPWLTVIAGLTARAHFWRQPPYNHLGYNHPRLGYFMDKSYLNPQRTQQTPVAWAY